MSLRILGPVRAIAMAMVVPVLVAVACSQTDPGFGTAASEKGRDQMDSSNETPMPIASPTPAAQFTLTVREVAAWHRKFRGGKGREAVLEPGLLS